MDSTRRVKKVLRSVPTIEGAGVHLKRAFGYHQLPELDPFLLLDDFGSSDPADYLKGFPWHPHRGIETITYLLRGTVEHGDSLGNEGIITAGDVQWMTAGSGIIHQEMPLGGEDGVMRGTQLWANLPATHKMMTPRYRDITGDQIPVVELEQGMKIRVIAGVVNGTRGPVQDIIIDPQYLDITLPAGKKFSHPVEAGYTVFCYILSGRGCFEPAGSPPSDRSAAPASIDDTAEDLVDSGCLVIFADGNQVEISAADAGIRLLLISGKPLGEPVAWRGPIVMNTQAELRIAFEEFQNGTFIKHQTTGR